MQRQFAVFALIACLLAFAGACKKQEQAQASGGMQGFPVKVEKVTVEPVGDSQEFLATLQSRNAAVLQPEVEGQITKIFVVSGAQVEAGQPIMEIADHEAALRRRIVAVTDRSRNPPFSGVCLASASPRSSRKSP